MINYYNVLCQCDILQFHFYQQTIILTLSVNSKKNKNYVWLSCLRYNIILFYFGGTETACWKWGGWQRLGRWWWWLLCSSVPGGGRCTPFYVKAKKKWSEMLLREALLYNWLYKKNVIDFHCKPHMHVTFQKLYKVEGAHWVVMWW